MAISKLRASRLRSISVEFPPQNAPGGISLTRRWTWSVLLADFLLCHHHHPHYRHSSSSSSHIPSSSLPKTIVNPIVTIVSPVFRVSGQKKKKTNLEKEKKTSFFVLNAKEKSLCLRPRALLSASLFSILNSYLLYFYPFRSKKIITYPFYSVKHGWFPSLQAAAASSKPWCWWWFCAISVLAFYGVLSFIVKPESCRAVSSAPLTTPILPPICHTTGPPFRQRNNNTVHTRFRSVQASTLHHITHHPLPAIPPLCRLQLPRTELVLDIMIQLTARGT